MMLFNLFAAIACIMNMNFPWAIIEFMGLLINKYNIDTYGEEYKLKYLILELKEIN